MTHDAPTAQPGGPGTVADVTDTPQGDFRLQRIAEARARTAAGGSDLDALPSRLSPSRASDYKQCPKMFYYKTICGIREPATQATLRGTLAHTAFERIFDHPQGERTPDIAVSYIRPAWEALVDPDLSVLETDKDRERALADAAEAIAVAEPGTDAETAFLASAEAVVRSWFDMERVNNFTPTNLELPSGERIDGREYHAQAEVGGVTLHGFIDRLDQYRTGDGRLITTVSDYKTGKAMSEGKKYAPHTMARIREEKFFQLKVYALLMWEMHQVPVSTLRLLYVKTGDKVKGIEPYQVTRQVIEGTRREITTLWKRITQSAKTGEWPTQTGPLCNYCFFQDICPAFATADTDVSDITAEVNARKAS